MDFLFWASPTFVSVNTFDICVVLNVNKASLFDYLVCYGEKRVLLKRTWPFQSYWFFSKLLVFLMARTNVGYGLIMEVISNR